MDGADLIGFFFCLSSWFQSLQNANTE